MKKLLGIAAVVLLSTVPVAAQKVYIDYDKTVDFDLYKTFAWAPTEEISLKDTSPMMHSRIKNEIEFKLTDGGMIEDTENPDLYVTYYSEENEQVRLNTTHYGYGYGYGYYRDPYWGGGVGHATTSVYTYTEGTLIIDIWDAETKELVWRAAATAVIKQKPEKQAKQISKAINKISKRWQKIYEGPQPATEE
jgi:hypothetical protein